MSRLSDERAVELLRKAVTIERGPSPPDLWPRMRRRLDERSTRPLTLDWILALAAVVLCLLQPAVVSILLLHF
jgi:hypothetical protein